ncbi:MAG: hypothetical protein J2P27_04885 [Actinobacteria bacterium]|nr:hypothetical protein [Actinomycetota bacterium]
MHRWMSGKRVARAGSHFTIAVLVVCGALTGAGSALAAGQGWTIVNSPNATLAGGQLESVSCTSSNACTAVGTYLNAAGINVTLAERWDGASWQKQNAPNPAEDTNSTVAPNLTGVSCPVSGSCEAVGSYQLGGSQVSLAEGWDGSSWTLQSVPFPDGSNSAGLTQVSCTSARFCEAVGSYFSIDGMVPLAATWNGTSWTLQFPPSPAGDTSLALNTVSCSSATFCEAWGSGNAGNPGPTVAELWDGASWQLQTVPTSAAVTAVSCKSAHFCEAVGNDPTGAVLAELWDGSSWTAQPVSGLAGGLQGVSCTSANFCQAVGATFSNGRVVGFAAQWNGSSWVAESPPGPASATFTSLAAVSCTSGSFCEAAGGSQVSSTAPPVKALAETWNGSSWAIQSAVAPRSATTNTLSSVSCVSATFCEAVGLRFNTSGNDVGLAEKWNGTSWTIQAVPNPTSQFAPTSGDLLGVSCVSPSFCEAVGAGANGAYAEMWDGTSWSLQTRPGADVNPEAVSCAAVAFCMAVDAFGRVGTWDGSSWSAGPTVPGFGRLSSVSCLSVNFCEVVGSGPAGENAAMFDGSSWTPQATAGVAGESLSAVTCSSTSACEAVGTAIGQGHPVTLAENWNGSTWTEQSIPNPAVSQDSRLAAVSCSSANSCATVGQYQFSPIGLFDTLVETWDGTAWSLAPSANNVNAGANLLGGVSCVTGGVCTAVGQTRDEGGIPDTLIETGSA